MSQRTPAGHPSSISHANRPDNTQPPLPSGSPLEIRHAQEAYSQSWDSVDEYSDQPSEENYNLRAKGRYTDLHENGDQKQQGGESAEWEDEHDEHTEHGNSTNIFAAIFAALFYARALYTTICDTYLNRTFAALFAFRLFNAYVLRTFFQPDEFFQSLEPAWAAAFGEDKGAWLTWEWTHRLRSSIHPLYFAMFYRLVSTLSTCLNLPDPVRASLLIATPKVVQAHFAALGDFYTFKLAQRIYGYDSRGEKAVLWATVLSPWQWFCSTRTFSNCLETTLTVMALNYWPWRWATWTPVPNNPALIRSEEPSSMNSILSSVLGHSKINRGSAFRLEGKRSSKPPMKWTLHTLHPNALLYLMDSPQPKNKEWGVYMIPQSYTQVSRLSYFDSLRVCLVLAALATLLRPTNVIIWLILGGNAFLHATLAQRMILVREAIFCGGLMLAVSIFADRSFYGFWTFPPLNFLYFNIAQSLAVFYGMNRPDYYLTEGYPLLLTTLFPFALYGMFSTLKNRRLTPSLHDRWQTATRVQLAVVCIAMPLMLSLITHKEVRFIYPLLPCLHVLAAVPLVQWFAPAVYYGGSRTWPRVLTMNFMILVNVVIAVYVSIYHGSGVISVLDYLRQRQEVNIAKFDDLKSRSPGSGSIPGLNMTAGFLMPCHSTPWRSHMVYPSIHAWALTCEPPINMNAAEKAIYRDEADQFYDNPEIFLATHMVGGLRHIPRRPSYTPGSRSLSPPSASRKPYVHEWPDYLVFFQQLEPTLKPLLRGSNYGECNRIYNSAWHDDWRRRGDVVVWCLDRQEKNAWRKEIQRRTEAKRDAHFDRVMSAIANRESGWGKLVPWHQEPFASILHFWREAVIPFLHVMRFFLTPFTLFGKAVYQGILSWLLRARSWVRGLISLPQTCGYGPWRSRNKYDIVMHHFGAKCPSLWQMSRRKIGEKIYGAQKWIVERFHIDEAFVVGDPRLRH
ncbi:GPI mannosyltransferase 3 [Penicillium chermesinum]|uniref:Mannosyltransferase n=1 Tax=Penicillium chermesinum TaxID=63820 RepID=A0A9W9TLG5_9EURO|nr:GPI mannosyltransferase 3 [Penicillium chermesinum]KAJ5225500.1 GPI mannosyltransferase 3 [Penicillium chermesinum]